MTKLDETPVEIFGGPADGRIIDIPLDYLPRDFPYLTLYGGTAPYRKFRVGPNRFVAVPEDQIQDVRKMGAKRYEADIEVPMFREKVVRDMVRQLSGLWLDQDCPRLLARHLSIIPGRPPFVDQVEFTMTWWVLGGGVELTVDDMNARWTAGVAGEVVGDGQPG